jgi:glycosyltransferase involved in cell wall biosynthesis
MIVYAYPAGFGHSTVMINLCRYLKKLGYDTAIGAFYFKKNPPKDIKTIKLNRIELLVKGINSIDYDIIHSHQPLMNYFLFTRKTTKPVIYHYHGSSNKLQKINFKIMSKLFRKKIRKIVSVSKTGIIQMKEMDNKIEADVVYNGVDTNFYNRDLPRTSKKGEPQLLFVSGLVYHKHAIELIKSIPDITKIFPNVHLQIVGEGEELENLRKNVKEKKLEQYIELTGRINDDELKLRYSSCDIYVSASTFEVCPVPTLEAMACGKPLVLFDIAPHNEIIAQSHAGVIFYSHTSNEISKKIKEAYNNKEELGMNARKFAENHDWSIISKQMDEIYRKILD